MESTFRSVVLGPCSMPNRSVVICRQYVQTKEQQGTGFLSISYVTGAKQACLAGKDVILNVSAGNVKANKLNLLRFCVILGNWPAKHEQLLSSPKDPNTDAQRLPSAAFLSMLGSLSYIRADAAGYTLILIAQVMGQLTEP